MASAINSLPVPVSPWINTVESVGATTRTRLSTRWRAALLPIILGKPLPLLSCATFADVAASITKNALWMIAGASAAQLVSTGIFLVLPFFSYAFGAHTLFRELKFGRTAQVG